VIDLSPFQYKTAARIVAALAAAAAAFLVSCGGSDGPQQGVLLTEPGPPPQQGPGGTSTKVRQIGSLDSTIADNILKQVNVVPFTLQQDTPILLQGKTMSSLTQSHNEELKATYRAGHTIVLLDATMEDIAALHGIIEGGVTYSSKDGEGYWRIPCARRTTSPQPHCCRMCILAPCEPHRAIRIPRVCRTRNKHTKGPRTSR